MIKKLLAFVAVLAISSFVFVGTTEAASHTVKKSETLYSLAKKYDTTVASIKKLNNLKSDALFINQVIKVTNTASTTASSTHPSNVKKTIKVTATAFTASCAGCSGITRTGINLKKNPNLKVIAVDPKIIPLGSKVWVEGYGIAIAGDTGGSIKGNKIDIFIATKTKAYQWGRKTVTVKVLKS